jgi:23S rRNA U2552 (ribose-2'-O)-methylase RlmE/FtsJ
VQLARDMVRHIERASAKGEWPQIAERFIRPGAIVSIDVQRPE